MDNKPSPILIYTILQFFVVTLYIITRVSNITAPSVIGLTYLFLKITIEYLCIILAGTVSSSVQWALVVIFIFIDILTMHISVFPTNWTYSNNMLII